MKKRIVLFSLIICIIMSACAGNKNSKNPSGPYIYYLDSTVTSLVSQPGEFEPETTPTLDDYFSKLSQAPIGSGLVAPLDGITILETNITEGKLTLDFGREYQALSTVKELLTRAAIVKTLTQSDEVKKVEFFVGGIPLSNTNGELVGSMDKDHFVDYFGKEQDALLSENLTIYFISEDGRELIPETHRVYFDNTLSLEQAVIKCMKEDPETSGARIAITQNANIINITTTDGTCYLDLDTSFYDSNSDINPSLAVAALANSLCELDSIRHVQVNIIEPSDDKNQDTLLESLSGVYEKNTDIIRK